MPISLLSFAWLIVFEVEAIKSDPIPYADILLYCGLAVSEADQQYSDQQYSSEEPQALIQPQELEPAQTQSLSQAEPQSRRCQQQQMRNWSQPQTQSQQQTSQQQTEDPNSRSRGVASSSWM